ncbi:MAG: radical SAM protein [Candidatus Omnitrophota bacterium]
MIRERASFLANYLFCKLLKRPRIFWATIYLTYACNFRCKHCYGKYGERYDNRESDDFTMHFDRVEYIVKKLAKYGCRYIALLGGEPLLHKDISKIINIIRTYGIEVAIVTNGSLIEANVDKLKKVSTLTISIDGDEEANDFLRGRGRYRRSLELIKKLKQYRINLHISTTLYKKSIDKIEDLLIFAGKHNVLVGFCPLMYQSYLDNDLAYLHPSDEQYRSFYNKVIKLKKGKKYPIMYSKESYKSMLKWPDFNKPLILRDESVSLKDMNFPECLAGKKYIYITPGGDIYPCSQLIGTEKFLAKNIFEDGFEEAWRHAWPIPCKACTNIGFLDLNMMLSFRLKSILSMVKQTFWEFLNR